MGGEVAICYRGLMSQPVKLSDGLVLDARIAGDAMERSIAGQVEFWARLGRSVETMLEGRHVLDLCRKSAARPISECLQSAGTPAGRQRVASFLEAQPFPHYEPCSDGSGLLVRTDERGRKTIGRFIKRTFRPVDTKPKR